MDNMSLKEIRRKQREGKKIGQLYDQQGFPIHEDDQIMYVTGGGSDMTFNYGVVVSIELKDGNWGHKRWSIKVFKEHSTGWMDKPKHVFLSYPTMYKVGVSIKYPGAIWE